MPSVNYYCTQDEQAKDNNVMQYDKFQPYVGC